MSFLPEDPRHFDALVAEQVMGWQWFYRTFPPRVGHEWATCWWILPQREHWTSEIAEFAPKDLTPGAADLEDLAVNWDMHLPRYSTDIRDAWLVVEHLSETHWLELKSPFSSGNFYTAGFTTSGCSGWNGYPDFQANGETAAISICKAAIALRTSDSYLRSGEK